MPKNWRTNLGGAISVTGTGLIGVGVVPQLVGVPSNILTWIAVSGFALSMIGKGVTAFFAADAATVNNVAAAVDKINALGSDPGSPPSATKPPFPPA